MEITLYNKDGDHVNIFPAYPNLPRPREHKVIGSEVEERSLPSTGAALEFAAAKGYTLAAPEQAWRSTEK